MKFTHHRYFTMPRLPPSLPSPSRLYTVTLPLTHPLYQALHFPDLPSPYTSCLANYQHIFNRGSNSLPVVCVTNVTGSIGAIKWSRRGSNPYIKACKRCHISHNFWKQKKVFLAHWIHFSQGKLRLGKAISPSKYQFEILFFLVTNVTNLIGAIKMCCQGSNP
jgi:hypothetical protein